jgi:hypothetical protein
MKRSRDLPLTVRPVVGMSDLLISRPVVDAG